MCEEWAPEKKEKKKKKHTHTHTTDHQESA
jgi:oligoribonuclease (3'-5' exoribonuclease)